MCGEVDELMQESWVHRVSEDDDSEDEKTKVWAMQPGMGQIGTFLVLFCCGFSDF